jgi:hypothetical protein
LRVSRDAVRNVIASDSVEVPKLVRPELAESYRDEILELIPSCKGNLVRVHEELLEQGAQLSYQALTGFCRRHDLGGQPVKVSGHYDFAPGEEMQHDTSPHYACVGSTSKLLVQTASLVMCFSRLLFFQHYARFTRFECKLFLMEALKYCEGSARRCMVDNTHVIVLCGTGKQMVPVPEMESFGERFQFKFEAHEKGDANRSARVEGPFCYIENNFLAGRRFDSIEHMNQEARVWCDKVNAKFSTKLHASRRELFAMEAAHLRPLPDWLPDVYRLHHRIVDLEGYVNVSRIRYSVPWKLIGRQVEVRETKDRLDVYDGPRIVASHPRVERPVNHRVTDPQHRPPRGALTPKNGPCSEELELLRIEPRLQEYVALIKQQAAGRCVRVLRKLLAMLRDYPRDCLIESIDRATQFQMLDPERLEKMILRKVAQDYFVLPDSTGERPDE